MITPTDWASAWCVRKSNHHVQYNIWEALISTEKPKNVGPDTWRIQIIPPQGKTNFKLCLWGEYKPRAASITEVWNEEEITVINRKTLFLSKRSIQAVKNKEELWRASVCSEDLCWETFCQHVHYRSFVSCDKLFNTCQNFISQLTRGSDLLQCDKTPKQDSLRDTNRCKNHLDYSHLVLYQNLLIVNIQLFAWLLYFLSFVSYIYSVNLLSFTYLIFWRILFGGK